MRVDEHGLGQFVRGAGELRQHQHAVAVDAGGDVLLGDEVHAVTQRGHQHDVAGAVERDELVQRQRLVEVVEHRLAEPGVAPVDLADEPLDLVALVAVVLDRFAGRRRHLDHHAAVGVEQAVVEQRARTPACADRSPSCSRGGRRRGGSPRGCRGVCGSRSTRGARCVGRRGRRARRRRSRWGTPRLSRDRRRW